MHTKKILMKTIFLYLIILVSLTTSIKCKKSINIPEDRRFISHTIDPKEGNLKMYWKGKDQIIYGAIDSLKKALKAKNKELVFAMNGGMYTKNQMPQGLYIEGGRTLQKIDTTQKGYGNFYLQPNGIFGLKENGEAIIEKTPSFTQDTSLQYATQSGPMLLIEGEYHPAINKGSKNIHIRNAVGILPDGKILFVISKEKVNFYDLAQHFKERGCTNALYLDGFVSKMYLTEKNQLDAGGAFGVIIAETK